MTMLNLGALTTAVLLAASAPADSADTAPATPAPVPGASFSRLQYIGGHPGLPERVRGTLVVQQNELGFFDKKKRPLFTLAIDARTSASRSEGREKSAGHIALLVLTFPFWGAAMATGMADPPSFSTTTHFVNVHSVTSSGSELVAFKCAKTTCEAIISRINSSAASAMARP